MNILLKIDFTFRFLSVYAYTRISNVIKRYDKHMFSVLCFYIDSNSKHSVKWLDHN